MMVLLEDRVINKDAVTVLQSQLDHFEEEKMKFLFCMIGKALAFTGLNRRR